MASDRELSQRSISSFATYLAQQFKNTDAKTKRTSIAEDAITATGIDEDVTLFNHAIQSADYEEGVAGWRISGVGNAEFENVYVRGTIDALGGSIGDWHISENVVSREFSSSALDPDTHTGTFIENYDLGADDTDVTSGKYVALFSATHVHNGTEELMSGLFVRDYSRRNFDTGYFSTDGLRYTAPSRFNLIYNPNIEYSGASDTNGWGINGSTSGYTTASINFSSATSPAYASYNGTFGYNTYWTTAQSSYVYATVDYANAITMNALDGNDVFALTFGLFLYYDALPTQKAISAWSSDGTYVTVTTTSAHGLIAGDWVYLDAVFLTTADSDLAVSKWDDSTKAVYVVDVPTGSTFRYYTPIAVTESSSTPGTSTGRGTPGRNPTTSTTQIVYDIGYIYKSFWSIMDMDGARIRFSNGTTVSLYSVLTADQQAVWADNPELIRYVNMSASEVVEEQLAAAEERFPFSVPTFEIDTAALLAAYATNDSSGYAANSNIYIDLPGWLYNANVDASTAEPLLTSTTKIKHSTAPGVGYAIDAMGLLSATGYYFDGESGSNYEFYSQSANPNRSLSISRGGNLIDIDTYYDYFNLNEVDNISFSHSFGKSLFSQPGIFTESSLVSSGILSTGTFESTLLTASSGVVSVPTAASATYKYSGEVSPYISSTSSGVKLTANQLYYNSSGDYVSASSNITDLTLSVNGTGTRYIAMNTDYVSIGSTEITPDTLLTVNGTGTMLRGRFTSTSDVSMISTTHTLQLGAGTATHMCLDGNEILVRGGPKLTVTNYVSTSVTATITTSIGHALAANDEVYIDGVHSTLNGWKTVTATPTATTFQIANGTTLSSTAVTGTAVKTANLLLHNDGYGFVNVGGPLTIKSTGVSVSTTSTRHPFTIGSTAATNLAFGTTTIQGRDTGAVSDLQLNPLGGEVRLSFDTVRIESDGTAAGAATDRAFMQVNTSGAAVRVGSTSATNAIIGTNGETNALRICAGNTDEDFDGGAIKLYANSHATLPDRMLFYTNNVEIARFNTAGELLIGKTTDSGAYLLQVNSQIWATNATIATSDGRYKEDVSTLGSGLDVVRLLRPVEFTWKPQEPVLSKNGDVLESAFNFADGRQVGFIAQEVEEALVDFPWAKSIVTKSDLSPVFDFDIDEYRDADGNLVQDVTKTVAREADYMYGITEGHLIPILVRAIQELDQRVSALGG